jgi:hypothetical protein
MSTGGCGKPNAISLPFRDESYHPFGRIWGSFTIGFTTLQYLHPNRGWGKLNPTKLLDNLGPFDHVGVPLEWLGFHMILHV